MLKKYRVNRVVMTNFHMGLTWNHAVNDSILTRGLHELMIKHQ